ncbi:hypothetical protein NPIL_65961, partial [Nephila pilipes]
HFGSLLDFLRRKSKLFISRKLQGKPSTTNS